MNKIVKNYIFLFVVAALLIAFDQWTKAQVRNSLALGSIWSPWEWMTPYARIVHWKNTGVAFGMFQGMGTVFAVLAAIVSLVIIYYYPRVAGDSWTLKIAMSMQLAGALGNFVDRITIKYVTDFISIGNFPVFNVADSCISVGVVILLVYVWMQEKKEKEQNPLAENAPLAEPVEASNSDDPASLRQSQGTGELQAQGTDVPLAEPVEAANSDDEASLRQAQGTGEVQAQGTGELHVQRTDIPAVEPIEVSIPGASQNE